MKLRTFEVRLLTWDEFSAKVKYTFENLDEVSRMDQEACFACHETFKRYFTLNKLQILRAIAKWKPASINQLAQLVEREFPHVLKDCHSLAKMRFIELQENEGARKQLTPKLVFDYDIIRVNAKLEEVYTITEKSNQVLLSAQA